VSEKSATAATVALVPIVRIICPSCVRARWIKDPGTGRTGHSARRAAWLVLEHVIGVF